MGHPKIKPHVWTEEQEGLLADMWNKKYSTQDIANFLSEKYGREFTRNAVIGKKNRLDLEKRPVVFLRTEVQDPPQKFHIREIPTKVSLRDVEVNQCRFSQETGADMMVCGKPTYKHYAFCRECCGIAYRDFGKPKAKL